MFHEIRTRDAEKDKIKCTELHVSVEAEM